MDLLYVNTGTTENSGDGDSIRTAFSKINYNFGVVTETIGAGGIADLDDVYAVDPDDGSVLIYHSSINKWVASVNMNKQNIDAGEY